jgi:hypothetical protein
VKERPRGAQLERALNSARRVPTRFGRELIWPKAISTPLYFCASCLRLGELRDPTSQWGPPTSEDLMDLFSPEVATGEEARSYLERHVDFLEGIGLVSQPARLAITSAVQLTTKGQMFVQPELAEFGEQPLLSYWDQ